MPELPYHSVKNKTLYRQSLTIHLRLSKQKPRSLTGALSTHNWNQNWQALWSEHKYVPEEFLVPLNSATNISKLSGLNSLVPQLPNLNRDSSHLYTSYRSFGSKLTFCQALKTAVMWATEQCRGKLIILNAAQYLNGSYEATWRTMRIKTKHGLPAHLLSLVYPVQGIR